MRADFQIEVWGVDEDYRIVIAFGIQLPIFKNSEAANCLVTLGISLRSYQYRNDGVLDQNFGDLCISP